MRGSITKLLRKRRCGFVLGEDGCEAYFDESALDGTGSTSLSVGQWVEYELQFGFERLRAINVRPLKGARDHSTSE
jgi:cold shock CspA family protein